MEIRAAFAIILGAVMLFGTHGWIKLAQDGHHRRVADRLARGHDAYFEELRSLKTYKPLRKVWVVRLFGIALLALGTGEFILNRVS